MTDSNGFSEYKRLYEERFRVNEERHQQIISKLESMGNKLDSLDDKVVKHSAWWGMVGACVVLGANFLLPLLIGGCR